jgi:hypothetical protein
MPSFVGHQHRHAGGLGCAEGGRAGRGHDQQESATRAVTAAAAARRTWLGDSGPERRCTIATMLSDWSSPVPSSTSHGPRGRTVTPAAKRACHAPADISIISLLLIRLIPAGDQALKAPYIHFVGTRPDLRGAGLGRRLYERFAHAARDPAPLHRPGGAGARRGLTRRADDGRAERRGRHRLVRRGAGPLQVPNVRAVRRGAAARHPRQDEQGRLRALYGAVTA